MLLNVKEGINEPGGRELPPLAVRALRLSNTVPQARSFVIANSFSIRSLDPYAAEPRLLNMSYGDYDIPFGYGEPPNEAIRKSL